MSEQISIQSYNNPERAIDYTQKTGFDPQRKAEMLHVTVDVLMDLLPEGSSVLELGAGSGLFTEKMIEMEHFSKIFVTDGAEAMLKIARSNLSSNPTNVVFDILDFTQPSWSKKYKDMKIDAVTSSMALHHAEDKGTLFKEIYNVLSAEGIFVFADHIAGTSTLIDQVIGTKRAKLKLGSLGEDKDDAHEIAKFIVADKEKQDAEGNKCESMGNYLDYLQAAGFKDVDCIWRDYWLAVFVAKKTDSLNK